MPAPRRRTLIWDALAAIGLVLPWIYIAQYLAGGGGLGPAAYVGSAMANALTSAFTFDLYLSALAFAVFVLHESARMGLRRPWLYILLCFGVGLSFALPLFLGQRERHWAAQAAQTA